MSLSQIHDNIVIAWRDGKEQTLYNIIDLKIDGTLTIRTSIMETTFDPHGSEESLRKFLQIYVK